MWTCISTSMPHTHQIWGACLVLTAMAGKFKVRAQARARVCVGGQGGGHYLVDI